MESIQLPTGIRGRKDSYKQNELLLNLFYEGVGTDIGTLMQRPGVREVIPGFGACRGAGLFKEQLYQVSNDRLIRITLSQDFIPTMPITAADVVVENLSDVELILGTKPCIFVAGFSKLLIMVVGGNAYVYDDINGLKQITDPSYKASSSCTYLNGFYIFQPVEGGPFFWSKLDDPSSIDPEDYADAGDFPDPNKLVRELNQTLYVGGTRSFQRLQYDATLDTFRSIQGTARNVGYVGGVADYGESFVFIGRGNNGGFSIYDIRDTNNPISNDTVDELLNTEYTLAELEQVEAQYFRWQNTNFVVFYLQRDTLVFYGDWAYWHSGVSGTPRGKLNYNHIQFAYGRLWCGDNIRSSIGILIDDSTDYGNDIEYEIDTYVRSLPRTKFIIKRIVAMCTNGQKNNNRRISLQVSDNGQVYGKEVWTELGELAEYNFEVSWGSPIGRFDSYCGLKIRWVGDITLNTDGLAYE